MTLTNRNFPLVVDLRTEIDDCDVSFVKVRTSIDEIPFVYRMLREYSINIGLSKFYFVISSDSLSFEF